MNKIIIEGNLAQDPEVREFARTGSRVLRLVVVTNEYTETGEAYGTTFHHVDVWNELSRTVEALGLHKGDAVHVEGRIKNDSYEKDGVRYYATSILANAVEAL